MIAEKMNVAECNSHWKVSLCKDWTYQKREFLQFFDYIFSPTIHCTSGRKHPYIFSRMPVVISRGMPFSLLNKNLGCRSETVWLLRPSAQQWRRQLWGTCPPYDLQQFHFSSLRSKSDNQLSKYCVVCEISWCRCQQLTALSISTALVTKLLVIEQLRHIT